MESQRNPAVKWGLIFGGLLILVALINYGIEYATGALNVPTTPTGVGRLNLGASLAQSCIVFLIEATLYFLAGMMTARENGRVGSGSIAGLIAGALYGVVAATAAVITVQTRGLQGAGATINPTTAHSILIVVSIVVVVLILAFAIGIGAGIGAIGGLVGRSQYERVHPAQPMVGSLYTPMAPPPGYPPSGYPPSGYPPAPGYPPSGYPPASGAYPPPQEGEYPPQTPPQTPPQQ